jgi:ketosteroid isomerase-like protein
MLKKATYMFSELSEIMNGRNRELVDNYLKHYNTKNIESMLDLFADDVEFESVSNTNGIMKANDKQQLRDLASNSAKYFEQRSQAPSSWVIDVNQVAIEVEFWCKLAEDLPNGKKKGEEMKLRGASFFTIRGDRICRLVDYM